MASRTKVLETLAQYFEDKGKILNSSEYSRETDVPIRIQQVRNIFGSWNRVEKLLMAREARYAADPTTDVEDVIAAENKKLMDELKARQEQAEDLDAKVAKELLDNKEAEVAALAAANPNASTLSVVTEDTKVDADVAKAKVEAEAAAKAKKS